MRVTTVGVFVAAVLAVSPVSAQEAADVAGRWEGALEAGGTTLRLIVDISRTGDGVLLGTLTSVDQGNVRLPIDAIEVDGSAVHLGVGAAKGAYNGTLSEDGTRLTGTWSQGVPLPLELTRSSDASATSPAPDPPPASPLGPLLDVWLPAAPAPFVGDGQTHLVYELHLTNFGPRAIPIRRIEVLPRDGDQPMASFEGAPLNAMLGPVGMPADAPAGGAAAQDQRTIPSGRRTVAFLWVTVEDPADVPETLRHRIAVGDQIVETPPEAVSVAVAPPVLGPPLRGGLWVAFNGPANGSLHRRAVLPVNGRAWIAQRFAIDWLKLDAQGRMLEGNAADNAAYFAYGEEALAAADAVVVAVMDGIPENVPGPTSRAVPITLETAGGNFVTLDLGDGRYAFYAHLQPGSLRVAVGDRVGRGQVLGLVGNSGNSTQPHLHFHVGDGPAHLGAEGIPYLIDAFEGFNQAIGGLEPHQRELPLQNAAVRFP